MWMNRMHTGYQCAAMAACLGMTSASMALPGAIFTTDRDGTVVNGNIYDDCCDVFLNGGPPPNAPCTSAGLPDGEYYFQVTDPSGAVLLSTDSIEERRFRVEGGLIVEYLGTTVGECMHELGDGKCAATVPENISIQLMPFDPTPNPGGVYKVHVTPVGNYDPSNAQSNFGFVPSATKTDNFKCEQAPPPPPPPPPDDCKIIIKKYKDRNGNGQNDGEPPLDGVKFEVCYPVDGWENCIEVTSGDHAPGEAKVDVPGGVMVLICEKLPSSDDGCTWMQTEPNEYSENAFYTDGQWCYYLQCPEEEDIVTIEFGNVCVDEMDYAKSIEYWTAPAGKTTLKQKDPNWRSQLNKCALRKMSGADCNMPGSSKSFNQAYNSLKNWMQGANDVNMAYELSAQLAVARLNIKFGVLNENYKVLLSADQADALGRTARTVRIKTLMKWADESLQQHNVTTISSPARGHQQMLAEILDDVNNNRLFRVFSAANSVVYE